MYPVIQLYNCIDENIENINRQKSSEKTNLEENITNLNTFDLKEFAQEKKEVTKTFFKILDFYKKHLISQKEAPYYIPIKGKGFNKENPLSLPPTGSYFNLLNSLLNDREILLNLNYLTQQEIEQFYKERTGVAKTICKRNNFNKRYLSSDHQSFFKRMLCDISDPMIIGYVETEKEFLEALSKIK